VEPEPDVHVPFVQVLGVQLLLAQVPDVQVPVVQLPFGQVVLVAADTAELLPSILASSAFVGQVEPELFRYCCSRLVRLELDVLVPSSCWSAAVFGQVEVVVLFVAALVSPLSGQVDGAASAGTIIIAEMATMATIEVRIIFVVLFMLHLPF
jgi:hypothetical protein